MYLGGCVCMTPTINTCLDTKKLQLWSSDFGAIAPPRLTSRLKLLGVRQGRRHYIIACLQVMCTDLAGAFDSSFQPIIS